MMCLVGKWAEGLKDPMRSLMIRIDGRVLFEFEINNSRRRVDIMVSRA